MVGKGVISRQEKVFFLSETSRPALWSTQPLIRWAPCDRSPG